MPVTNKLLRATTVHPLPGTLDIMAYKDTTNNSTWVQIYENIVIGIHSWSYYLPENTF